MSDEQRVYDAILRLGCAQGSVNELSVVYAFPRIAVYGIIRALVQNGRIERTTTGALKIAVRTAVLTPALSAPPQAAESVAELRKPTRKRKYFSRLNPRKDLTRQMASRIIHYLAHIWTGPILYITLYKNLQASRYTDYIGHDLWVEALEYLGGAIRRKRGMIWLERETKRVSKLPWPYQRVNRAKPPRKQRARSAWFDDIAHRAEASGFDIKEQIAADRGAQLAVTNT